MFITDDFLLHNATAKRLYHEIAAHEPIIDYHNHLPPADVADNRRFANLHAFWLEGDHYKWRAMRAAGVAETYITGEASPYEKFQAWADVVPQTLRNPLYHWTHLELKRIFGIETLLNSDTAQEIWDAAGRQLAGPGFGATDLLRKFNVGTICTTDDPTDSLEHHNRFRHTSGLAMRMHPTFRPDKAFGVDQPDSFRKWCGALESATGMSTATFGAFMSALDTRLDYFHEQGCRLSDHGLERIHAMPCTEHEATTIFERARSGLAATPLEREKYASYVLHHLCKRYCENGWVQQFHLGPIRNNNPRLRREVGADCGCDSIGDFAQAVPLSRLLGQLDDHDQLAKTILYNINPADNYVFATMAGNFQGALTPGRIQWGAAWWFLDQKEGIEWHLNNLSSLGLLSTFVGFLTDSRSFGSFCRHEYFRRVLCNLLGQDIEKGEIPADDCLVGDLVRRLCHGNAHAWFPFEKGMA